MYRENLQGKDKVTKVAEPPGQAKTGTPTRGRGRCGGGGVGEIRLVKHNVSGDEDPARGEVKASLHLVVRGVTKKHTLSRAGRQLVRSSGGDVRITCTPEDTKVVVARRGTEKSMVWSEQEKQKTEDG